MGANVGHLGAGRVLKGKGQSGKMPTTDSYAYKGGLSQSKITRGTNQPNKSFGSDKFSHSYNLKKGGPVHGKGN